jgi:hypothetical protein
LFWKAQLVLAAEAPDSNLKKVILRLGGFYTCVSFLGCIGKLMSGSGLRQVLEVAYAPNSVDPMLSGKAYARAIRDHFLVDTALNALVTAKAFGITLDVDRDRDGEAEDP